MVACSELRFRQDCTVSADSSENGRNGSPPVLARFGLLFARLCQIDPAMTRRFRDDHHRLQSVAQSSTHLVRKQPMQVPPKIGTTFEKRFQVNLEYTVDFSAEGIPPILATPWVIWF